jgi:cytochrome d ubiquinol oxidase subunit I
VDVCGSAAQIAAGDFHGINTPEHQLAKVMAMEGHYDSYPGWQPPSCSAFLTPLKTHRHAIQPHPSSLILNEGAQRKTHKDTDNFLSR